MNRPFYAFGALLTALALAMLAVSSTTRSTTVGQAVAIAKPVDVPAQTGAAVGHSARFCGILVVLPAAAEQNVAITSALAPAPSYRTGCGLDRLTGRVYPPVGSDWCDWECPGMCPLLAYSAAPVALERVTLAVHDPARLQEEASRDCRSRYDAVYDSIVYGDDDRPAEPSNLPTAPSAAMEIDWNDYLQLADAALHSSAPDVATAESSSPVQSSRWLLHFAASSLSRASSVLESAADELRRASDRTTEDQLAGERQPSQR